MRELLLPRSEWGRVWLSTALILVVSTVASWVICNHVMMSLDHAMSDASRILAVGMPTALGGPILLFLQIRSAQLREANRKLEGLAATNRSVVLHVVFFAELRDGRLFRVRAFFDAYGAAVALGVLPRAGTLGEKALLMLRGFGLPRR